MEISVYPTALSLPPLDGFQGWVPVAIDVLRATTTIVTALAAGARAVVPALDPDEARAAVAAHSGALLGGERGNVRIPGFDLGNSPLEYTPERVAGRVIGFTTSNGTRAIRAVAPLGPVYIAALANAGAVAHWLRALGRPVLVACAGAGAEPALEDTVCAGALVAALGPQAAPNDFGWLARELYERWRGDLRTLLRTARHGQRLVAQGFGADVDYCAALDRFDLVPVCRDGVIALEA